MAATKVLMVGLFVSLLVSPATASTYLWRGLNSGHSGADGLTFDLAANWSPLGTPAGSDIASFDALSTYAGTLHLASPRPVSLVSVTGSIVPFDNSIALNTSTVSIGGAGPGAEFDLVGGSMSCAWDIGAASGGGTAKVLSGAHVTSSSTQVGDVGPGTLAIDGAGSSWTLTSGSLGLGTATVPGTVAITHGGTFTTVGFNAARGMVTIDGAGSNWTDSNLITGVCGAAVSGGAHLDWQGAELAVASQVVDPGSQWHSRGSLNVIGPLGVGAGGQLITDGQVGVGFQGPAILSVSGNGAQWQASGKVLVGVGDFGEVAVSGGGDLTTTGEFDIGNGHQSSADVSSGGQWHYSSLRVSQYADANLQLDSGGLLEGPGVAFTADGSSKGTIQLSDAGTRWHVTGDQNIGQIIDGGIGDDVTVESNALLDCDGKLEIDYGGRVTVESGGTLKSDQLVISPFPGTVGAAIIVAGGLIRANVVSFATPGTQAYLGSLQLGNAYGPSTGSFTIKQGSAVGMDVGTVGEDAAATEIVQTTLNANSMIVGDAPTGNGTCLIGGTNTISGPLTVGRQGTGRYEVTIGTASVGTDLVIAEQVGSNGTVQVQTGSLSVGKSGFLGGSRSGAGGTGSIQFLDSGSLGITDTLYVFHLGSINAPSGNLSASVINLEGGALRARTHIHGKIINEGLFACDPDTIDFASAHVDGDYEQRGSGRLELRVPSLTQHDSLAVTGAFTMAGTLALDMDPGLSPTPGRRVGLASASSFSGAFASVSGLPPPNGSTHWAPQVQSGSLYLVAVTSTSLPLSGRAGIAGLALAMFAAGIGTLAGRRRGRAS